MNSSGLNCDPKLVWTTFGSEAETSPGAGFSAGGSPAGLVADVDVGMPPAIDAWGSMANRVPPTSRKLTKA